MGYSRDEKNERVIKGHPLRKKPDRDEKKKKILAKMKEDHERKSSQVRS